MPRGIYKGNKGHTTAQATKDKISVKLKGLKASDTAKENMKKAQAKRINYGKGEKSNNWKGGKPKCLDCGKMINYGSKRCNDCKSKKGKLSHRWKGGKENNKKVNKLWQEKNKDRISILKKKWLKDNDKKIKIWRKEYNKINKEKIALSRKLSRIKNRDKILLRNAKRRALKKGAEGSHTLKEWETLKAQYNYTCPCCKNKEPFENQKYKNLTIDHIIPLIKGGSHNIENIQPLCQSCNSSKNSKIIKYINV